MPLWGTTFDINTLLGTDISEIKKQWDKSKDGKDSDGKLLEQLEKACNGECNIPAHCDNPFKLCTQGHGGTWYYDHFQSGLHDLYDKQKMAAEKGWPAEIVTIRDLYNFNAGGARKKKQRNTRRNRNNRRQSQSKKNQKKSRQSRRQSQSKKNQKKN
mgnify:CR=1 FL=1|tara:strand:- start:194 stop:664 length:471 start_codon:yes stop_codon:yes gene_type:complete